MLTNNVVSFEQPGPVRYSLDSLTIFTENVKASEGQEGCWFLYVGGRTHATVQVGIEHRYISAGHFLYTQGFLLFVQDIDDSCCWIESLEQHNPIIMLQRTDIVFHKYHSV